MREIELHSRKYPGLIVFIDDQDYELVSRFTWCPTKGLNTFYAKTAVAHSAGSNRQVFPAMHRLIAGWPQFVDHKDGNGLNNQRDNLRPATRGQNRSNSQKCADVSSRFKGVCWNKQAGKWQAGYRINRENIYLGLFVDETEAALAYDRAALKAFGKFSRVNFPEGQ